MEKRNVECSVEICEMSAIPYIHQARPLPLSSYLEKKIKLHLTFDIPEAYLEFI